MWRFSFSITALPADRPAACVERSQTGSRRTPRIGRPRTAVSSSANRTWAADTPPLPFSFPNPRRSCNGPIAASPDRQSLPNCEGSNCTVSSSNFQSSSAASRTFRFRQIEAVKRRIIFEAIKKRLPGQFFRNVNGFRLIRLMARDNGRLVQGQLSVDHIDPHPALQDIFPGIGVQPQVDLVVRSIRPLGALMADELKFDLQSRIGLRFGQESQRVYFHVSKVPGGIEVNS